MKYVLIGFLILLFLLLLLLFSRLNGGASYDENGFRAYIKLWGFKKQLYPRKKKPRKKKISKKNAEKAEKSEKQEKPQTDVLNLLKKQMELVSSIKGRLTITNIRIKMEIGTGDAAETAVLCGSLYAAIYTILGFSQNVFFINKPEIVIIPDYSGKTAKGEYQAEISAKVITYLMIAFKALKILQKD